MGQLKIAVNNYVRDDQWNTLVTYTFSENETLFWLRPDTMHITINQSTMKPATVVRDLGVLFDGELSMR